MHQLLQHLPHLYVFRLVAELGSFQAAAQTLKLPRSSVSKKVMQLEQHLEQKLLQRSTRQLKITEEGQALLSATNELDQLIQKTEQLKNTQQGEPIGRVKISSSTLLGHRYLLPQIAALRKRYRQIQFEINISDSIVDLIAEGVDIALRVGHLPDSSLVAKKIGEKSWCCFASPQYLKDCPALLTPADLANHPCLIFKNGAFTMDYWTFSNADNQVLKIKINDAICSDDGRSLAELAALATGIVFVDPLLIQPELKNGLLIPVLTEWSHPEVSPIHLVRLGKRPRNKAVDTVWRFLGEQLQQTMNHVDPSTMRY